MRPDDLNEERLDEVLRRLPRWQPPHHFAPAVVARMPEASPVPPSVWRVPLVGRALGICAGGALLTYVGGLLIARAVPSLLENAVTVGWASAVVALSVALAVTAGVEEWI